jgi:FkbM family methyltransferase
MSLLVDSNPFGACVADRFTQATLAVTRSLPANYIGLRISMPLRRLALNRLGDRAIDTTVWNARARLYPYRNSCEKVALFTPQMYDVLEFRVLSDAIDRRLAAGKTFTFIDIGANVGLYSLFVAGKAGALGRVLAIEPQPGIGARLEFNLRSNPGCKSEILAVAVSDRAGELDLVIDESNLGGTHVPRGPSSPAGHAAVRVQCRTLADIVAAAKLSEIDALKIDIEGHEDKALAPYLRDAPRELLPSLILIEDNPSWEIDLGARLTEAGYAVTARSRHNVVYTLTSV